MRLVVARIGRPHGVQGEVTIEVRTDSPEKRFEVGSILFSENNQSQKFTFASARNHNGTLLLKFEEISDRNKAEQLKNTILSAEVDVEKESSEDEFHLQKILGTQVYSTSGELIGRVIDVVHLPGQDLLVIEYQAREVMIPFVKEIVPVVDLEKNKIVLADKEGLLDE